MVWGVMSSACGPHFRAFKLHSSNKLHEDAGYIFQQDLSHAHSTKTVKDWLNDHYVTVHDWPVNSLELNSWIENLWGDVTRTIRDTRLSNTNELKATNKATWASMTPQQIHRPFTSMIQWRSYSHQRSPKHVLINRHTVQKANIWYKCFFVLFFFFVIFNGNLI